MRRISFVSRCVGAHSPYGTQMFLTCVAARRNSRPSPSSRIEPVAVVPRRPRALHVRRRRQLDRLHALARAEVPHGVDVVVLGEHFRQRVLVAGDDVDDAAGNIRRFEHTDRSPSPRADGSATESTTVVLPVAIAGATSEMRPSSGNSSGHAMPITPIGSFIASATPRIGTLCTAPSYLSAHAPYVNSREIDASTSCFARSAAARRSSHRSAPANSLGARREILGDVVEDLRAVVSGRARPALRRRVRRFDGVANVLAIAFRRLRRPARRSARECAACSRRRGAPACRR